MQITIDGQWTEDGSTVEILLEEISELEVCLIFKYEDGDQRSIIIERKEMKKVLEILSWE